MMEIVAYRLNLIYKNRNFETSNMGDFHVKVFTPGT